MGVARRITVALPASQCDEASESSVTNRFLACVQDVVQEYQFSTNADYPLESIKKEHPDAVNFFVRLGEKGSRRVFLEPRLSLTGRVASVWAGVFPAWRGSVEPVFLNVCEDLCRRLQQEFGTNSVRCLSGE
jgi:hypothetical protein